jgi:hypothetical protein
MSIAAGPLAAHAIADQDRDAAVRPGGVPARRTAIAKADATLTPELR